MKKVQFATWSVTLVLCIMCFKSNKQQSSILYRKRMDKNTVVEHIVSQTP